MPTDTNSTVRKPYIHLYGDTIRSDGSEGGFSERVDYAKHLEPGATTLITGVTILDKEDILTFNNSVRVIITGQMTPKPTYVRESGAFGSLTFEGNTTNNTGGANKDFVNYQAETWYTFNGKDPIRTKASFYNFQDLDNANYQEDPSEDRWDIENLNDLGFVLRTSPAGSDIITLKAKTYFRNEESKISVVIFKIVRNEDVSRDFYQLPR